MGSKLSRQSSLGGEAAGFRRSRGSRGRRRDAGDAGGAGGEILFSSLVLGSEKLPGVLRKSSPPYQRRVAWVRQIQKLLREQKVEEAADVLKLLRKV